eukprot:gene19329-38617_t
MTTAAVAAIDIHKRYKGRDGEVHAVRGVNLSVSAGE